MHKVKRKRFLQEQKKKRRKEKIKQHHMSVLSSSKAENTSVIHRFKHADKYVGCNEALQTYFAPANGKYYRIVHNPPEQNDELVQSEQVFEGLAPSMPGLAETIAEGSSLEVQFEHIADYALSFGIDDQLLADKYWAGFDKRRNDNQRRNYVKRKGDVMGLYYLLPEAGFMQIQPDDDGHVVLAEYDDFELEKYRVREFGLPPLTNYRHEKK